MFKVCFSSTFLIHTEQLWESLNIQQNLKLWTCDDAGCSFLQFNANFLDVKIETGSSVSFHQSTFSITASDEPEEGSQKNGTVIQVQPRSCATDTGLDTYVSITESEASATIVVISEDIPQTEVYTDDPISFEICDFSFQDVCKDTVDQSVCDELKSVVDPRLDGTQKAPLLNKNVPWIKQAHKV